MTGEPAVSACIVCRNEADRLGDCLDSVAWADEVIVMDLESSDGSGDLARAWGARVVSRAPLPIVEPLREELGAQARGRWILALDPDERVSPGLARELSRIARESEADAVVVPRMNVDFGHAPSSPLQRHEPQLRMYRRERVRWPSIPNALPHVPPERTVRLPGRDDLVLVHIRNRTIPEALERAMRYAPAEAQAMLEHGETFSARAMLGALASAIDRNVIATRAWRDGMPGMLRAATLVAFKLWVWSCLWQLSERGRTPEDDRVIARRGGAAALGWRGARRLARLAGRARGRAAPRGGESWRRRAARQQTAEREGRTGA